MEEKNIVMVHVKYRLFLLDPALSGQKGVYYYVLVWQKLLNQTYIQRLPSTLISSATRPDCSDLVLCIHRPHTMNREAAKIFARQGDSGPAAVARSPPIVELARFLARALTLSYGVLSRTTVALILSLLAPLSLLFTPISYLLSPVFILIQVLLDVFVFTPYSIIAAIAPNLYPVYVFLGAAVICALVLGFAARTVCSVILRILFAPRPKAKPPVPQLEPEREAPPPPEPKEKEKGSLRTGASKTRTRKRVSIKDERDR